MSAVPTPLVNLLLRAEAARVRFWPEGGQVQYRSPGPMEPGLRALVVAHKPALLAWLGEWNPVEASRLEFEADARVGALGVSGLDALIQRAAERCADAHHREDMAGVRLWCALVEDRARALAGSGSARADGERRQPTPRPPP